MIGSDFRGNLDNVLHTDTRGMRTSAGAFENSDGRSKDLLCSSDVVGDDRVVFDPAQLNDMLEVGKTGAASAVVQDASSLSIGDLAGCIKEFILLERCNYKLIFSIIKFGITSHEQAKFRVHTSCDVVSWGLDGTISVCGFGLGADSIGDCSWGGNLRDRSNSIFIFLLRGKSI
jgi:hypothetical protein